MLLLPPKLELPHSTHALFTFLHYTIQTSTKVFISLLSLQTFEDLTLEEGSMHERKDAWRGYFYERKDACLINALHFIQKDEKYTALISHIHVPIASIAICFRWPSAGTRIICLLSNHFIWNWRQNHKWGTMRSWRKKHDIINTVIQWEVMHKLLQVSQLELF